jgi:hypothetical protein
LPYCKNAILLNNKDGVDFCNYEKGQWFDNFLNDTSNISYRIIINTSSVNSSILTRVLLTIITKDNNLTFEIEDEETSK